jgi:hypothetical protein
MLHEIEFNRKSIDFCRQLKSEKTIRLIENSYVIFCWTPILKKLMITFTHISMSAIIRLIEHIHLQYLLFFLIIIPHYEFYYNHNFRTGWINNFNINSPGGYWNDGWIIYDFWFVWKLWMCQLKRWKIICILCCFSEKTANL